MADCCIRTVACIVGRRDDFLVQDEGSRVVSESDSEYKCVGLVFFLGAN